MRVFDAADGKPVYFFDAVDGRPPDGL